MPGGERGQQVGERAACRTAGTGAVSRVERFRVVGQAAAGPCGGISAVGVAAVASESAWAKARVWRTVSGPSPASLTRRLRSSAVEVPV